MRLRNDACKLRRFQAATKSRGNLGSQRSQLIFVKLYSAIELWRLWPSSIRKFQGVPLSCGRIARDHVEMDVRVNHHQHQIVDAFEGAEFGEYALDRGDRIALLGKCLTREHAIRGGIALGREDERAERDLGRAQQD